MSGIAGIVHFNGRPLDERLLRRMIGAMAFRGPDGEHTWLDRCAGLGHTLLRTTRESQNELQPASLDGRVWIAADARVDDRAELLRKLESHGRTSLTHANDAQLILHAYQTWGERCAEHLLGDFAFAIWDGPARRLFCARDHFGVKPFYYALVPDGIVFSNTLECIRLHPAVGDTLNEVAIRDFLLFGYNQDPGATAFAQIRRLPPAHSLACRDDSPRVRRYWAAPTDGRIRYRRSRDYVDHFSALLRTAVSDRLPMSRAGVWMTGGLDSTSIAATARQLMSERGAPFDLLAHTIVYDSLIPDEERFYAGVAAAALGVRSSYFAADGYKPFDGWNQPELRTPEPTDDPFLLLRLQQLKRCASHSPVVLSGEGGDELLWRSYAVDLVGKVPLIELGADIARSLIVHHRRPACGIRASLEKSFGYDSQRPAYPGWLNRAFADRTDLRVRYEQVAARTLATSHPVRPEAHRRLVSARWPWYLESGDPGVTGIPVEARYPFLDVRLVNFALAIPALPWFIDKQLLREAMRGSLPDQTRLRPKVPLAGDPLRAHLAQQGAEHDGQYVWEELRPWCLNHWLAHLHDTRSGQGESDDDQVDELQRERSWQEGVRAAATGGVRRHS